MTNESIFFTHALFVLFFTFISLRLGKEALVLFVGLQSVLANLFVLKQIEFFSLTITCSDVYVIGSILSLNFIQEFFNKETAIKSTYISFFALFFFSAVSYFHLAYEPSRFDASQPHYAAIFTVMPWMALMSIVVFFISQRFDIFFFGVLKKLPIPFAIRSGISMIISQTLDTGLFTFLALRNLVDDPLAVFSVSLMIKCSIALLMTTFLQIAKLCLPQKRLNPSI